MAMGDEHGHTLCLGYLPISVAKHWAKATYKGECLFVDHDSRRLESITISEGSKGSGRQAWRWNSS